MLSGREFSAGYFGVDRFVWTALRHMPIATNPSAIKHTLIPSIGHSETAEVLLTLTVARTKSCIERRR